MISKVRDIIASALRFIACKLDGKSMVENHHVHNEIHLYANGDPEAIARQIAWHTKMLNSKR